MRRAFGHALQIGAVLAGCIVLTVLGMAASAAARSGSSAKQSRIGHAPSVPAGARSAGALPSETVLSVTLALKPRNPRALAAYAEAVSDPGSPDYRAYLTVSQFARRFGASPQQIASVRAALRSRGLIPGRVSANALAIPVRATVAHLARAFSTRFQRFVLAGGRVAFANTEAPALPGSAARYVEAAIGLNNLAHPVPQAIRYRAGARRPQTAPRVATGGPQPCQGVTSAAASQPGTYTTDQIAYAYGFPQLYGAGDLGAGQTIAVYELEADIPSDISAYQACYGTAATVSTIPVDGGPSPLNVQNFGGLETDLDVQTAIGLAPHARILIYQGPNNSGSGPYDTYNAIVSQDLASVITTSWGICEATIGMADARAEAQLFQEAAIQGQTVVAAAGDSGAEDCYPMTGSRNPAVDDPASQPFVTGVGGTRLTVGPPRSETVWNSGSSAGGGGISSLWAMPSYQASAPASLNVINPFSSGTPCGTSSGYCREVPDVSANADPATGILVYWNGNGDPSDQSAWGGVGGTSGASPMWAALIALADGSTSCAGSPIGFANPALYRAAAAGNGDFYDVTSGDNSLSVSNAGVYPAMGGYDMASGLGTPGSGALAMALCSATLSLGNPGTQTSGIGGPVQVQIQAHDVPGKAIRYGATGLPPGLAIDGASGLISGSPTALGTYAVTISATDEDGSTAHTSFAWTVVPVTVTVADPGSRINGVGTGVRLQITARASNGAALSYSAAGLPSGLSIDRSSGLITGRPSRSGIWSVSVSAATGNTSSSAQFTWTIEGRPNVSHASLRGLPRRRPRLSFALSTGSHGSPIVRLRISLPSGLGFAGGIRALRRGIILKGSQGAPITFTVRRVRGALVIELPSATDRLNATISWPALSVNASLARRVSRRVVRRLRLTVTPTDQSGWAPRLGLSLRV